MTKLLEQAVEAARQLPPEQQNAVAEVILSATPVATININDDQRETILQGLEEARTEVFAVEQHVHAL